MDVFVERIKNKDYESLNTFVNSFKDLNEFADYVNEVVEIIDDRTKRIEEKLKKSAYSNNH